MALIQITPENLRVQAKTVRKYNQDQQQTMKSLRKLILSLNEHWKGAAQDAFVAKFNSMDYAVKDLARVLEMYAVLMETAAQDMESADNVMCSKIQSIK